MDEKEACPSTFDEQQAIRAWWDRWWEQDYSWLGLTKKAFRASEFVDEMNLDEYWRIDPRTGAIRDDDTLRRNGELEDFDGRTWHIVHLPLRSRDGNVESWKCDPGSSR